MATDKKLIHTAGCIIIGDEVLGGKVGAKILQSPSFAVQLVKVARRELTFVPSHPDLRHQQRILCKILLLIGHHLEAHRGDCGR